MRSARSRPTARPARRCTSNSAERPDHRLVLDAGLFVHLADRLEAVRAVERDRVRLRRERDLAVAAPTRRVHERLEDRCTDAAPAPVLEDRHAPDMAVGQEAAGADRARSFKSNGVNRKSIVLVELDLRGHALLLHEHLEANRRSELARALPAHELDSRHVAKSIIAA